MLQVTIFNYIADDYNKKITVMADCMLCDAVTMRNVKGLPGIG